MSIKVGINGFGRIGRITLRALLEKKNMEIVAINDLTDASVLAHLFKYDSAHGRFSGTVEARENHLLINGKPIPIFSEKDPQKLPWGKLGAEIILESTGIFVDEEGAKKHLAAGAKRVAISAPAKGNIPFVVLGVNEEALHSGAPIISNASCTTNCLSPMVKVLDENWEIETGFMTTVHAYTADQRLQDAPHKDLRRARAAATSIVPTSTGAAGAVGKVLPKVAGKLDGIAMRVPTITGSITDFTAWLSQPVTKEEINEKIKYASENDLKGILSFCQEPIVSADVVGSPFSCIFDAQLTNANGRMVKVVGWYDNEAGYSHRMADLLEKMAQ